MNDPLCVLTTSGACANARIDKKAGAHEHRLRRYMTFVRGDSAKFIPAAGRAISPRRARNQCRRMDASPDGDARARKGSSRKR
jgi:hypothetical protein